MTKQELNRDIKKLWLRYKKEYLNREPDQFWTEKIGGERAGNILRNENRAKETL